MNRSLSITALYTPFIFTRTTKDNYYYFFNIKVNALFLSLYDKIKSPKDNVSEYCTLISISIDVLFSCVIFLNSILRSYCQIWINSDILQQTYLIHLLERTWIGQIFQSFKLNFSRPEGLFWEKAQWVSVWFTVFC